MTVISVVTADPHPVVRKGLLQICTQTADLALVGEAGDYASLAALLRGGPCRVAVLELGLAGTRGVEALRELRGVPAPPGLVVFSAHPVERYGLRAVKAGAGAYLTKDAPPEMLVEAIRTVAKGQKYITAPLAQLMAENLDRGDDEPLHRSLSDREFMVLRLLGQGGTVSSIAAHLHLSIKTVSTYRTRILRKMQLQNNAELTYYAIRQGLVD